MPHRMKLQRSSTSDGCGCTCLEMGIKVCEVSPLGREEIKQPVIKSCLPQQLDQVVHGVSRQVVLEERCDEVQNRAFGNHAVVH